MPIVSTQTYLLQQLNGLILPGSAGTLDAFITPPNPREDPAPGLYIWPSTAPETRQTSPRQNVQGVTPGKAGYKILDHSFDCWLLWFDSEDDPQQDVTFPGIVDTIMSVLREVTDPADIYDPNSGLASQLVDIGERMTYEIATPRAVADQRYLRYDALITIKVMELFQA
jgi:hypothetical protein